MDDIPENDSHLFGIEKHTRLEMAMFDNMVSGDLLPPGKKLHIGDTEGIVGGQGVKYYSHGHFRNMRTRPPIVDLLSVDTVRGWTADDIKQICSHYLRLRMIVERYEAIIQGRWSKKSKHKRRAILQSAWGKEFKPMATGHRPDIAHIMSGCCLEGLRMSHRDTPAIRQFFLWSSINLEDLCNLEPILLLLNARGRNPPSKFAFADLQPAMCHMKMGNLPPPLFLDGWSMSFIEDGPLEYGRLVSWEGNADAYERLKKGLDVSPGEGIWLLEIQEQLYKFLVKVCEGILYDIPLDPLALTNAPIKPEPPLPTINRRRSTSGGSDTTSRYEEIYHVPAKFDLRRLQTMIAIKCSEAEDRVRGLREDPAFFATVLQEVSEHHYRYLQYIDGSYEEGSETTERRRELIENVVLIVLGYYLSAAQKWATVLDRVVELVELKEKLFDGSNIQPHEDLPQELALGLLRLYFFVRSMLEWNMEQIEILVQISPPVRDLFYRCNANTKGKGGFMIYRSTTKTTASKAEFLDIIRFVSRAQLRWKIGARTCVQELERVTQGHEARELITRYIAERVSDICIMSECTHQIESFKPWFSTALYKTRVDKATYVKAKNDHYRTALTMIPAYRFVPSFKARRLGAKVAMMKYPVDKGYSKANVEAMQAAERCLDEFWELVIPEMKIAGIYNGRIEEVLARAKPERTPDWISPVEKANEKPWDDRMAQPFGGMPPTADEAPRKVEGKKAKKKRRGIPRPTEPAAPEATDDQQEQQQEPGPMFTVDRSAMQVFEALFYRPSAASQQPGEIPWSHFLQAMHQVGFAMEHLGGSVWQFVPGPDLEQCGSEYSRGIQFHEPHPSHKIPYYMARTFGRRLAKAYAWHIGMFGSRK